MRGGRAKRPGDATRLALAIQAVVVEPVAGPRREGPEAHHGLNWPQVRIQLQPHELAGVAVGIGEPALVERTRGQLAQAAVRIDPFHHFRLMEMAAQDEVGAVGQQAFDGSAVGELMQRVMHQDDAQARKRVAAVVAEVAAQLVFGEEQTAGIRIVAAQPRGVQAHDVNRQMPGKEHVRPVAEPVRNEIRTMELASHPGPIALFPVEDRGLPGVFEAQWRRTDAVHPSRDAQQVGGGGQSPAHRLPHVLLRAPVNVVIAGDDKETVGLEVELFEQRAEKVGDFGVLLELAGLRGIAGEEDKVDAAFFIEQRF